MSNIRTFETAGFVQNSGLILEGSREMLGTFTKLREQISLLDVFERDIVPPLSLHESIAASQFQGASPELRVTEKHRVLHNTPCLFFELRSPKSRIPNQLPDYNGINPKGDNPEGDNPEGENPVGTAPCGTYAIGATDGPCGAWFTAQYSITLSPPPLTTITTTKTTWVTEVASEAAE
ncbi:MAG: hypothetical protein Q9172_006431 [Xanthocarpia lactea]